MTTIHTPRVRIVSPAPVPTRPFVPIVLTTITVDDVEWAVFGYKVEGDVDGIQRVTLTFAADVTLENR